MEDFLEETESNLRKVRWICGTIFGPPT